MWSQRSSGQNRQKPRKTKRCPPFPAHGRGADWKSRWWRKWSRLPSRQTPTPTKKTGQAAWRAATSILPGYGNHGTTQRTRRSGLWSTCSAWGGGPISPGRWARIERASSAESGGTITSRPRSTRTSGARRRTGPSRRVSREWGPNVRPSTQMWCSLAHCSPMLTLTLTLTLTRVRDCQAAPWPHRQCDQEPVELQPAQGNPNPNPNPNPTPQPQP